MTLRRWNLPVLGLALLLPLGLAAQQGPAARQTGPGVVSGVVVAEEGGAPIASASVAVRRMADSVVVGGKITDRQGRFRVDALPAGSYLVEVTGVGRATVRRRGVELTAAAPATDLGTIQLAAAAVQIGGVTARGTAPPMRIASDRTIYTLRDMPVVAGGVATDVLRTVPEIEVDVDGKITAMGSSPAVHLNGRPAPMQGEALTAFLQNLPADRIDRVEFIPNPSARYEAEGQGGILNIVLREDANLGLSGTVSANAGTKGQQGGSVRLNYQEGRFTFFGGTSLSRSRSASDSYDLRTNLLATPVSLIEQQSNNTSSSMYGGLDVTAEWKLSPRATVWSGLRGNRSGGESDGLSRLLHMNESESPTQRYDRVTGSERSYLSGHGSLGFRNVVQAARNEQSMELRFTRNGSDNLNESERLERALVTGELLGLPAIGIHNDVEQVDDEISFNLDVSRPWGEMGRIDVGYRGSRRVQENDQVIDNFTGASTASDSTILRGFEHQELFNSLYLTVDRKIGRMGIQLGARAERADTRFTLPREEESHENDYTSLFPSASLSYDLGGGRQVRASYSKRVQRPPAFYLNPINTSTDPLNAFIGNPGLKPSYTHSFTFEASSNTSFGSVRVAPYYRRMTDVWDQLRTVDQSGASTVSIFNLRSSKTMGSNVSLSLRQLGPFSGLLAFQGFRSESDAGNISDRYSRDQLSWSANGNITTRLQPTLTVQTSGFYNPERSLPQGTLSSFFYLTMSARKQILNNKASISLSVVDPFDTYQQRLITTDVSHLQTSRSNFSMRRATLSVSYNFGRPPQSSRRSGGEGEMAPQEPVGGGGVGGIQ